MILRSTQGLMFLIFYRNMLCRFHDQRSTEYACLEPSIRFQLERHHRHSSSYPRMHQRRPIKWPKWRMGTPSPYVQPYIFFPHLHRVRSSIKHVQTCRNQTKPHLITNRKLNTHKTELTAPQNSPTYRQSSSRAVHIHKWLAL